MKKILSTCVLALAVAAVVCQERPTAEKPNYKTAIDRFEKFYNAGLYDSVYAGFSPMLQGYISKDSTARLLTRMKADAGNIKGRRLDGWVNNVAARYTVAFERDTLTINFAADGQCRLMGFLVKAYMPQAPVGLPK